MNYNYLHFVLKSYQRRSNATSLRNVRAEQERQRAEQEYQRAEQVMQQLKDVETLLKKYRDRFGELDS